MPSNAGSDNDTSTLAATLSSAATTAAVAQPTKFPPPGFRPTYPNPRPTVSLDARPIVIPILSCVFSFPVLAFAIICALRYRAQRLRRRDQIRRLQGGTRSVTLELPPGAERPSFFSRDDDSSSDVTLKQPGDIVEDYNSMGTSSKNPCSLSRNNNNHVKFVTTTAVLHVLRRSSTATACGTVKLDPTLYEVQTSSWQESSDGGPDDDYPDEEYSDDRDEEYSR